MNNEKDKEKNEPKLLENDMATSAWKYFSSRADESGTMIRTVIFAAANAGIFFSFEWLFSESTCTRPATFVFLASIMFFFSGIVIFLSWLLQKKKSQDRRSRLALHAKESDVIKTLEMCMDGEKGEKRFNKIEKQRHNNEWYTNIPNRCLDLVAVLLIFGAYLLLLTGLIQPIA